MVITVVLYSDTILVNMNKSVKMLDAQANRNNVTFKLKFHDFNDFAIGM